MVPASGEPPFRWRKGASLWDYRIECIVVIVESTGVLGMRSAEFETVAFQRDLSPFVAPSLFLVLLFPETCTAGDDKIFVGPFSVIIARSCLGFVSVVFNDMSWDFSRVESLEGRIRFASIFFITGNGNIFFISVAISGKL